MPCYHPIPAWRSQHRVQLHKQLPDSTPLQVPCGTCVGCLSTRAQHWALRSHLEAMDHRQTCVATLTYDDAYLPNALQKRDLQLFLKRLRKRNEHTIRYFACGEYGELYGRPHYHAILFGLSSGDSSINDAWQLGRIDTDNASIPAINYITGYTAKKIGWRHADRYEKLNKETGELYTWEPPFQVMSRRPGLGSTAKKHYHSWALYAISNGAKISIPRYYKTAYTEQAKPNEQEETDYKKYQHALTRHEITEQQLNTKEIIHHARNKLQTALRRYE